MSVTNSFPEVYTQGVYRTWTVGWLALFLVACDGAEQLIVVPPPPDLGVVDMGTPDSGVVDMGTVDMGTPDSGVVDMGEPPPAREPVYIHTGRTLFSYDAMSNTTQRVGDFVERRGALENVMVDIAIDNQGRLFGGTLNRGSEENDIFQIDPETGYCFFKFSFNDDLNGMTFLPDGRLVIAGERISVIDPDNGDLLLEFSAAQQYQTSGDVVGLPDGQLYWTVRSADNDNDGVVRIDPLTGRVTWLGEARLGRLYGLGYANGELYGFSSNGFVVTIDPTTGNVIRQNMLEGRWNGATTNPVVWE